MNNGFSYTQLTAALKAWPQNQGTEYVAEIDRFIMSAELRLLRDLNLDLFDPVDSSATVTAGNRLVNKPAGCIQLRAMRVAPVVSTTSEPADADALCLIQGTTENETDLLLNGVAGDPGVPVMPAQVTVTQSAGANGVEIIVRGVDAYGMAAAELITTVNGSTILSTERFATITEVISRNGSSGQTVTVGVAAVAASSFGRMTSVVQRSWDFCHSYAEDPSVVGTPEYYNELSETQWELALAADKTYGVIVHFIKRPASIVLAGNTWLGDNMGDLLFLACLMEAERYLKADDRYDDWVKQYSTELLPVARAEVRNNIRNGDYDPYRPAAKAVGAK